MGPDGGTVAKVEGGFQLEALDLEVGEQTQLPMALDLRNAGVSSYGAHQATVYIDGNSQDTLQFYVVPVDQPPT